MQAVLQYFTPNSCTSHRSAVGLGLLWAVGTLILWQLITVPFLPKPLAVVSSFETLRRQGTFLEFGTSIETMLESVFWTVLITLSLTYLSVIPALRPIVNFYAGMRYLGLVGLMLAFTLIAPTGHDLKVMVLTFGMSVFYLKDMLTIVQQIPQEHYDHAETLGLSPFRVVYEVVVLGTLAEALASLRVNAAMGWMMLTTVEGVVRSEGGIGTVLLNMNRHMDLSAVSAILLMLFCIGALQDLSIRFVTDYILCPYAKLSRGHR